MVVNGHGSAPGKSSARRVQRALDELGYAFDVREFPASTRTAQEAAAAIGCTVGQIAKSLVFRATESDRSILVMASGSNRVDVSILAAEIGEEVEQAGADFVRMYTGFVIGGVPPVGHLERPVAFIDRDLLYFAEIWAAAGPPNAVFRLTPEELVAITAGRIVDVKQT